VAGLGYHRAHPAYPAPVAGHETHGTHAIARRRGPDEAQSEPSRSGSGEQIPGARSERTRELPNRPQGYRPSRLDPLVVAEAEATLHHVLLGEAAALAERADALPEHFAEALKRFLHSGRRR